MHLRWKHPMTVCALNQNGSATLAKKCVFLNAAIVKRLVQPAQNGTIANAPMKEHVLPLAHLALIETKSIAFGKYNPRLVTWARFL